MKFTGERYIPTDELLNDEIRFEHLHRYHAITQLVKNKRVLDIACGEGYGTNIIAGYARNAVGVDIDHESIAHAKKTYGNSNTSFTQGSITQIPFDDNSFDFVVSFETLEHVSMNDQHVFLKEIKRVLTSDGVLVMSTPNKHNYSIRYNHYNKYHLHELSDIEYIDLIKQYFNYQEVFHQGYEIVSVINNLPSEKEPNLAQYNLTEEIDKNAEIKRKYLITIASDVILDDSTKKISSIVARVNQNYLDLLDDYIRLIKKNQKVTYSFDEHSSAENNRSLLIEMIYLDWINLKFHLTRYLQV